tara:strand:- start:846 stop:1034 length:189 start_codon:yes stop_codon:yes gene_type:complete
MAQSPFCFAFQIFRASASINLYSFPIHTSSLGVGVDAAIKLATVTIIVMMLIAVKIVLIAFP